MLLVSRWTIAVAACVAMTLIAWAYWPGLAGPFLFDDYGNLNALGAFGPVDHWRTFFYYISSGTADPTGRPVALLTFLVDGHGWPADPWPFKRTNLILHLLNTALLAWVITRLQAALKRKRPELPVSPWTPVLAATLWGAHPFFVSTTLYVVQREAMLPMTFVLMALLAWDRAMLQFARQRPRAAWLWAIVGLGGATLLAGLSKANGFLAPSLVGLAYLWFLQSDRQSQTTTQRRPMNAAAVACLGLPSLMLLAYLAHAGWQSWSLTELPSRDWTLAERLLSEPRAIWTYVARLAMPRAGGGGVFVDDFAVSRGWLEPATTLPAILALAISVVAAIAYRQRFPIASFTWLFFLAAHLLESSVIPLELYFEHRNYLPAAFLGWPLAHALLRPARHHRIRALMACVVLAGMLLLTRQRALVWGNPPVLAALSAQQQANSPRAHVLAAQHEINRGDASAGLARILAAQRRHPDSVDVAINAISFECAVTGALAPATLARTRHTLATVENWNHGLYTWLQNAATNEDLRRCRGFGHVGLNTLVRTAEANPRDQPSERKRDLWHVRGRIALADGRPDIALQWFDAALLIKPHPEYALVQAAALGEAGAPSLGARHLNHYIRISGGMSPVRVHDMPTLHEWLLWRNGYYQKQVSYLLEQLSADNDTKAAGSDNANGHHPPQGSAKST